MASELKITINLEYAKGNASVSKQVNNLGIDVSGTVVASGVQAVGTSEEALGLNGATTGGYLYMKNLDDTNFLELRSGTGATDVVKLKAGEAALFRLSGDSSAPFVIADTAECDLEYVLLSD